MRVLAQEDVVGSLGNLYDSIEDLDETYMQPNQNKNSLLNPKATTQVPLLLPNVESSTARKVYICPASSGSSVYGRSLCTGYFSDAPNAICTNCLNRMSKAVTYVAPPSRKEDSTSSEGGFVKGMVTYMVMIWWWSPCLPSPVLLFSTGLISRK